MLANTPGMGMVIVVATSPATALHIGIGIGMWCFRRPRNGAFENTRKHAEKQGSNCGETGADYSPCCFDGAPDCHWDVVPCFILLGLGLLWFGLWVLIQ